MQLPSLKSSVLTEQSFSELEASITNSLPRWWLQQWQRALVNLLLLWLLRWGLLRGNKDGLVSNFQPTHETRNFPLFAEEWIYSMDNTIQYMYVCSCTYISSVWGSLVLAPINNVRLLWACEREQIVSQELSIKVWLFLRQGGQVACEVTGKS